MSSDMVQGSSKDMLADDSYDLPPPLKKSRKSKDKEGKGKSKKIKAEEESHVAAEGEEKPAVSQQEQQQALAITPSHIPGAHRSTRAGKDFKSVKATSRFPLAPIFAQDLLDGVRQCLQSWIMRYIPSIDGVLVSFTWPPEILQSNAPLAPSSAYVLVHATWTGCMFRPEIGQKTTGRISLSTPSTISLLLHNLFNASIAVDQIPTDEYEWDPHARLPYTLATQPASQSSPRKPSAIEPQDPSLANIFIEGEEDLEADLGCWVHKVTRDPLGGTTGYVDFTVIGLTIANSMISTHGSLLSKPSPEKNGHDASPTRAKSKGSKKRKRDRQA